MNESEVRALVRDEMRILVGSMAEAADWYTCGYDDHTESAANLVKDVAARMASDLATEPELCKHTDTRNFGPRAGLRCVACNEPLPPAPAPEPFNPFAPKRTAEQWAVILRATIDAAVKDGHEVWVSGNREEGPMSLRVGIGSGAPVAFEEES